MRRLLALGFSLALATVFLSAQSGLSDDEANKLISQLRNTPASHVGSSLPSVPFSEWLASQAGKDADIVWALRIPQDPSVGPLMLEAGISYERQPALVIMIEASKRKNRYAI